MYVIILAGHMPKILMFLPQPPPWAGPEVIAREIISSQTVGRNRDVIHVNANIRRSNLRKGNLDTQGIGSFLRVYFRFLRHLLKSEVLFMYFSSNRIGFLKDSVFMSTAAGLRRKIAAQYHGSFFRRFYMSRGPLYKLWTRFVLDRLDLILVLGNALKKDFEGITSTRTGTLPNGIADPAGPGISADKFTDTKTFNFLFMGHLTYAKGFYDLVLAYLKLVNRHGDQVRLLFAGENVGDTPRTADFLGASARRFFLRRSAEINRTIQDFIKNSARYHAEYLGSIYGAKKAEAFRNSHVLVLPSYTEGFSMACLEAMAHGLPVITTPVGAMPEIIENQVNGLLTDVSDSGMLSDQMDLLFRNRGLCRRMSENNINKVKEKYGIEMISRSLMDYLRDLES